MTNMRTHSTRSKRQSILPARFREETANSLQQKFKKIKKQRPPEEPNVFDPAIPADMNALTKASGIEMMGTASEQAQWPVRVYNTNTACRFGVAAKRLIRKGETIAPYLGEAYTYDEKNELNDTQLAYAFQLREDDYVLADQRASVVAFVNHSFSIPNVSHKVDKRGQLLFVALTDIPENSALLIDYGPYYKFPIQELYLCPYQNGKSPAENLKQYKELYSSHTIKLTDDLKRILDITDSPATHCVVPKIFFEPGLLKHHRYNIHKYLPVYLVVIKNKKMTTLCERNQPYISTLLLACATRDAKKIKELLENDADVFAKTMHHKSVLNIATQTLLPDFKNLYLSIVEKIHEKYVTLGEPEKTFVSYINNHVNSYEALVHIRAAYSAYSFKRLIQQKELTTAETKTQNAEQGRTPKEIKKSKRPEQITDAKTEKEEKRVNGFSSKNMLEKLQPREHSSETQQKRVCLEMQKTREMGMVEAEENAVMLLGSRFGTAFAPPLHARPLTPSVRQNCFALTWSPTLFLHSLPSDSEVPSSSSVADQESFKKSCEGLSKMSPS